MYLRKEQVTHKGERTKRSGKASYTPVHKALSASSTYSLKHVFINEKNQVLFGKEAFMKLLIALKIVNEHKQTTGIRRKRRLGICLHSRMVGACVGGHTQESLPIHIKNTAVFLQADFFFLILKFVSSVSKSCKPSS